MYYIQNPNATVTGKDMVTILNMVSNAEKDSRAALKSVARRT